MLQPSPTHLALHAKWRADAAPVRWPVLCVASPRELEDGPARVHAPRLLPRLRLLGGGGGGGGAGAGAGAAGAGASGKCCCSITAPMVATHAYDKYSQERI